MKKSMIKGSILCGTMVLVGLNSGLTAQAADSLSGNTNVGAEVTTGDVILKVNSSTDFGQKPLDKVVDFGKKNINYTVTDYTGTKNGFSISAKLGDSDTTRSLKIGDKELSETAVAVVIAGSNTVGPNEGVVEASLIYTDAQDTQKLNSVIEWELTNTTTREISE
ncbi:hypothetical protein [Brochothrix thermosphacta]|uniref:hypothetical protein n=1 Tax=Brochothrix thermosphacta TaxID=2756 RepID=UPI00265C9E98|nr:hypothetical protein [Brochothrix thermosphacta]WKK68808.1 hypothetical protein Q0G00_11075 [Brochothrix thermosphacta]